MIEKFTPYKGIAILPGPRTSFLDHLLPLCHLWNIPLLCTDPWVYTCGQIFYPKCEILLSKEHEFEEILSHYHTFVTVEPARLHPKAFQFGTYIYRGVGQTIAGFHGNPSKFREEYWIERYAEEDCVLYYGQYLKEYLKEKGVWQRLKKTERVGNYRKIFYEKHRAFFEASLKNHLPNNEGKKVILWCPTWNYPDEFNLYECVAKILPSDYFLVLKLHPYTYRLYPDEVALLKKSLEMRGNALILGEIPLIYPLLAHADIYLGCESSVAYDFLAFDRPLFFFGKKEFSWGRKIENLDQIPSIFKEEDRQSLERKITYQNVFS